MKMKYLFQVGIDSTNLMMMQVSIRHGWWDTYTRSKDQASFFLQYRNSKLHDQYFVDATEYLRTGNDNDKECWRVNEKQRVTRKTLWNKKTYPIQDAYDTILEGKKMSLGTFLF